MSSSQPHRTATASQLSAFGIDPQLAPGVTTARIPGGATDARLALIALGATVALAYAFEGVTALGQAPALASSFVAIAVALALCLARAGGHTGRLLAGLLGLALAAIWLLSRTVGLPTAPAWQPQPVGLLDSVCALDSLIVGVLGVVVCERQWLPARALRTPLTHTGLLLAIASLAVLASGHSHGSALAAGRATGVAHYVLFCHLL